jgi:MoaA/NifB/PqqE/SkfB family radical SAM enzyme
MLKKTSCIAPFINLTVDPINNTSPCPYLGGGSWNFANETSFKSIWQSKNFEDLRQSHLAGEKNPICQRCWTEEDVGKMSARLRYLQDFSKQLEQITQKIKDKSYLEGPSILTMKNGNICNLQCRTCGPKDSYSWIPEAKSHIKNFPEHLDGTWFRSEAFKKNWSNEQLKDFQNFNKNLTRVEHFGGEPLHNPKVVEHTQMLVDLGYAKDIVLYMNTNGTHIPNDKLQKLFSHFKLVEFNLSIDGVSNQFEYIRHPAKWEKLLQTIEWCNKQKNFMWGIVTTVSILNIFYLNEILKTFDQWNKTNVFLNILEGPQYYSIKNLPQATKNIITKMYNGNNKLQSVVNFMNSEKQIEKHWNEFKFWTKQKDNYRKQTFQFTFPEFHSII